MFGFDKRKALDKLHELRSWKELEDGFPDQRSCFKWAAQVEPLLDFNLVYKLNFNTKLQILHRNVSSYTAGPALQEMITIVDMAVNQLSHQLESEPSSPVKLGSPAADYVHQSRIKELAAAKPKNLDLTKLVQLCSELNSSLRESNFFSLIVICRAILDHVPPVFGFKNFNEVTNNYAGTTSFKASMERLNNSSRKIADQHLHTPMRSSEVLPTITQVDFSNDLDVLLAEVVRITKQA